MTASILYLIPDTNVFIECQALENLNWRALEDFHDHDEIRLVICSEVRRELDNLKTSRTNRVSKRAREANARIRKLILSGDDCEIIRDKAPSVQLCLGDDSLHIPTLDGLDPSQADDRIVGYTAAYAREHPDADVFMLTDDIGPMGTAKQLNVPFQPVPASWRRVAEPDDRDKDILALKKHIAELEANEPRFEIVWLDQDDTKSERLNFDWEYYPPLTDDELDDLMSTLRSQHPIVTNFGRSEPANRASRGLDRLFSDAQEYRPAPAQDIREYQQEYKNWLSECRNVLSKLHESLQYLVPQPTCGFSIRNVGTRPGESALVEIRAKGNILVRPPRREPDSIARFRDSDPLEALALPPPPKAPRGVWQPGVDSMMARVTPHLPEIIDTLGRGIEFGAPSPMYGPLLDDSSTSNRDLDGLYYRGGKPAVPVKSFELTCDHWRHGRDAKTFELEVHPESDGGDVRGQIECVVHCKNLSTPFRERVSISVAVATRPTKGRAISLIDDLRRRRSKQTP